ncbi:MAG: hypothetical protein IMZ59_02845 [Actinobacteria bacterium]|nr:hypothetical protein [Actinomycetota bacterium]
MIYYMPALVIRFDINKVGSRAYGIECWKVFWRAVDVKKLSGTLLSGGDTNATLNGREYVYCIAIRSLNTAILDEIRTALEQSTEFQKIAASTMFIKNVLVAKEHLIDAGRVDSAGNLIGYAHNSREALGMVRKEKQEFVQAGQPSAPIPLRKKPASNRTNNLPSISSLKGLLNFLLTNFGEKNKWEFWVTPEELCDIVEQYADILQVQWDVHPCGLSEDMTYITLFNKGKAGENIDLNGLFPFPTELEAKQFCYDQRANLEYLFGQLEGLWGIQGRFGTNFNGKNLSDWVDDKYYMKEHDIDAFDLWPRICRRCEALGISPSCE